MRRLVHSGFSILALGAALSFGASFPAAAEDMIEAPQTCYQKVTVYKCDTNGHCVPISSTMMEVPCPR